MNRLTLTQELARFLGTEDPDNITSTVSPGADYREDLVNAIDTAYDELQTLHKDWRWRRSQGSLSTVASQRTYALSDIDATAIDVFHLVGGTRYNRYWLIDTHEVGYVRYGDWRGWQDRGTRSSAKPQYYTIQPDYTIEFDPTPDDAYTVTLDFLKDVETFSADADTPDFPARFHKVLVYMAAEYMLEFDENALRMQMAQRRRRQLMNDLKQDQLPQVEFDVTAIGTQRLY